MKKFDNKVFFAMLAAYLIPLFIVIFLNNFVSGIWSNLIEGALIFWVIIFTLIYFRSDKKKK